MSNYVIKRGTLCFEIREFTGVKTHCFPSIAETPLVEFLTDTGHNVRVNDCKGDPIRTHRYKNV